MEKKYGLARLRSKSQLGKIRMLEMLLYAQTIILIELLVLLALLIF